MVTNEKKGIDVLMHYLTIDERKRFTINVLNEDGLFELYNLLQWPYLRHCDIVANAFCWHLTVEGGQYWKNIFIRILEKQIEYNNGFTQTSEN